MYWFGVLAGAYGAMIVQPTLWWQPLAWVALGLGIDLGVQWLVAQNHRRQRRRMIREALADHARYFSGYSAKPNDE